MKRTTVVTMLSLLVVVLIASSVPVGGQSSQSSDREWKPAVYQGLTMGVSTKDDVISALGKPRAVGREQDTGIPTLTYEVSEPVRGTLVVYLKKGLVDGMTLVPKKQLSKSDVQKLFGPSPLRVRYAPADCLTEGGSAPIYESPDGSIEHLEYRSQGTAVVLHDNVIQAIAFVKGAFGPSRSPCNGRKKRQDSSEVRKRK